MWDARKPTAASDSARCTAWKVTLPAGLTIKRSVAASPAATEAVSATSAKTPE